MEFHTCRRRTTRRLRASGSRFRVGLQNWTAGRVAGWVAGLDCSAHCRVSARHSAGSLDCCSPLCSLTVPCAWQLPASKPSLRSACSAAAPMLPPSSQSAATQPALRRGRIRICFPFRWLPSPGRCGLKVPGLKPESRRVGAHLDLVVIATADEERLALVELHASDGALMLVKAVDESAHPIVPQLQARRRRSLLCSPTASPTWSASNYAMSASHSVQWQVQKGGQPPAGRGGRGGSHLNNATVQRSEDPWPAADRTREHGAPQTCGVRGLPKLCREGDENDSAEKHPHYSANSDREFWLISHLCGWKERPFTRLLLVSNCARTTHDVSAAPSDHTALNAGGKLLTFVSIVLGGDLRPDARMCSCGSCLLNESL